MKALNTRSPHYLRSRGGGGAESPGPLQSPDPIDDSDEWEPVPVGDSVRDTPPQSELSDLLFFPPQFSPQPTTARPAGDDTDALSEDDQAGVQITLPPRQLDPSDVKVFSSTDDDELDHEKIYPEKSAVRARLSEDEKKRRNREYNHYRRKILKAAKDHEENLAGFPIPKKVAEVIASCKGNLHHYVAKDDSYPTSQHARIAFLELAEAFSLGVRVHRHMEGINVYADPQAPTENGCQRDIPVIKVVKRGNEWIVVSANLGRLQRVPSKPPGFNGTDIAPALVEEVLRRGVSLTGTDATRLLTGLYRRPDRLSKSVLMKARSVSLIQAYGEPDVSFQVSSIALSYCQCMHPPFVD